MKGGFRPLIEEMKARDIIITVVIVFKTEHTNLENFPGCIHSWPPEKSSLSDHVGFSFPKAK